MVDRAYLISHNKAIFFDQEALAEANRYEAALYTAIEYNQPQCVEIMLQHLGNKELGKHNFYTKDTNREQLTAAELACIRGIQTDNKRWDTIFHCTLLPYSSTAVLFRCYVFRAVLTCEVFTDMGLPRILIIKNDRTQSKITLSKHLFLPR